MNFPIKTEIDMSGLQRGLHFAQQYTNRTPAQLVNTTGAEVAIVAKNTMPFVTMPTIDAELAVIKVPRIGKRGKPLKKSPNYKGGTGTSKNPAVPLSVLIIQARARPGSGYNQSTNSRYAIRASPFKGVSRAAGRAAMAAAESRMIKTRHSSGSFLKAGWIPAVRIMLTYSVNKYRRGSSAGPPLEGAKSYFGANLGSATPAQAGSTNATCIIENLIGYEGKNAASFNRALQLHGLPTLQAAVDGEGAKNMQYYLDHSAKEELEGPVNRAWG